MWEAAAPRPHNPNPIHPGQPPRPHNPNPIHPEQPPRPHNPNPIHPGQPPRPLRASPPSRPPRHSIPPQYPASWRQIKRWAATLHIVSRHIVSRHIVSRSSAGRPPSTASARLGLLADLFCGWPATTHTVPNRLTRVPALFPTQVASARVFWPAEGYHQRYLQKGGQNADKECDVPVRCYG